MPGGGELANVQVVAAIASALAAWVALVLSGFSFYNSRQAFKLSRAEARKKSPLLALYLQQSYFKRSDQRFRQYAFFLSITNESDTNNSIRDVLMSLTYRRDGEEYQVRTSALDDQAELGSAEATTRRLFAPFRIDAHQVTSGWCYFRISDEILGGSVVERVLIAVVDSYGNEQAVESMVLKEYTDDV